MSGDMPSRRRYSEKEVGRLLKRAVELQRTAPAPPTTSGLTLEELEAAAAEAGLDPALVRQAAAELEGGLPVGAGPKLGQALAGAPVRIVLERSLPGELPPAAFASLVPAIQAASDAPGQASQVGSTLTWHSQSSSNVRSLQVIISTHDDRTLIRIEERYGGLVAAVFGGGLGGLGGISMGAGGALASTLGSVALGVALPAACFGAAYLGTRAVYASIVRRRRRMLEQLMATITQQVRPASAGSLPRSQP